MFLSYMFRSALAAAMALILCSCTLPTAAPTAMPVPATPVPPTAAPTASDPAVTPQPDPAVEALAGLLDALTRGSDPTPFLARPVIDAAAGGQTYQWLLGLSPDMLQGYSVAASSEPTVLEGSVLVSATLRYADREEPRTFNVVSEQGAWKVYSTIVR